LAARKHKAMSQTQLMAAFDAWRSRLPATSKRAMALLLGHTPRTVYRWWAGHGAPSIQDVQRLEAQKPGLVALLCPTQENTL
jgi:hypothetical protein